MTFGVNLKLLGAMFLKHRGCMFMCVLQTHGSLDAFDWATKLHLMRLEKSSKVVLTAWHI